MQQERPIATFDSEFILPEKASGWLAKTDPTRNRQIYQSHVSTLAHDFAQGAFGFNPADNIVFDWNDELRNGQHRLAACVKSGVGFWAIVVRNADPNSFSAMDSGVKRNSADDLHMMGLDYPKETARVAKFLFVDEQGLLGYSVSRVSRQDVLKIVANRGAEIKAAIEFIRGLDLLPELTASRTAYSYIRFARQDRAKAQAFFRLLSTQENLPKGHAVLLLVKAIQTHLKLRRILGDKHVIGLLSKAWVLFRDGRTGTALVLRKGEVWSDITQKEEAQPEEIAAASVPLLPPADTGAGLQASL